VPQAATIGQAPSRLGRPGVPGPPRAFLASLLLAAGLHALLLFGVGFELPDAPADQRAVRPLEILVLRQPAATDVEPETADAYAQVNREGGGTDGERRMTDQPPPEPAVQPALPTPAEGPPPPRANPGSGPQTPPADAVVAVPGEGPEPEQPPAPPPAEVTALPLTGESPPEAPPLPEARPEPPAVTAGQILASRNLEIARLTAKIREDASSYAGRKRRKAVSASTREYKYASYLEAWRRKVERVGNLNYPEEAKERRLYGSLILQVALRADGGLEDVRVLRSSGFDVLDEAAVRIVELAAPFAPFPPGIRAETDILDITRTWQFLSSNRLGWEN
jgi:protein TonB